MSIKSLVIQGTCRSFISRLVQPVESKGEHQIAAARLIREGSACKQLGYDIGQIGG